MAKRKYLALLLLLPNISSASPWLPEEGKYELISSLYMPDKTSIKNSKEESRAHYIIEQEIRFLENSKDDILGNVNLTQQAQKNRIKKIDGKIHNLKNMRSRISNYYPKRTLSQSLEYGFNDNYSINFKTFYQAQQSFIGRQQNNVGFAAGIKLRLKQTERHIISMQPSLGIYRNDCNKDYMIGELRLLLGRATKHKAGKAFNTL